METAELRAAQDAYEAGLNRAERIGIEHDYADLRTTPARVAMRLSNISERECCLLIACLHHQIEQSGWGHTDAGQVAIESLMDAHAVLERAAELSEEA